MEYSVYDLIRILLKKWYVVLIVMAVIGAAAVFLSQGSFSAAQENYEEYTTQTIPPETNTGMYTAVYQCSFQMNSYDHYRTLVEQKYSFLWDYAQNASGSELQILPDEALYSMANEAYSYASADFAELLTSALVIERVQTYAEEEGYTEPPVLLGDGTVDTSQQTSLTVSNHLTASATADGLLTLTATGLPEEIGGSLIANYLTQIQSMGEEQYDMVIKTEAQSSAFTPDHSIYTDDALLSQTVMQAPQAAPAPVKAAATGAAFGFVFACFGVLLFTFIRDSRTSAAKK